MSIDFERYYREIAKLHITSMSGDEMHAHCPFHDDNVSSLSVNKLTGLWKCFGGCQEGGNVFQFHVKLNSSKAWTQARAKREIEISLGTYKILSPDLVEKHHKQLLNNKQLLDFLQTERGISIATVKDFKLGMEDDRILIPIFDEYGYLVNIRKYKPHATEKKVLSYARGYGTFKLFPIHNLKHDEILLVEGELDCLLANQLGYPAITGTCGAGTFPEEILPLFKDKIIYICYDIDEAGNKGAIMIARQLASVAKVKIINLPITTPDNADLTDYIITHKKTKDDLGILIRDAKYVIADKLPETKTKDTTIYDVRLDEAANSKYYYKKTKMKVIVSGKDLAPYFAPKKILLTCNQKGKFCKACPIHLNNGRITLDFSIEDNEILQLIRCSSGQQKAIIREKLNIPRCSNFEFEMVDIINIEEIRVIPEIDYTAQDMEYVTRQVYYIGYGIKTNRAYLMEGITVPDPKTQYVTQIISDANPTQSSVDQFKMTKELFNDLQIFKTDNISELIKEINNDLTNNVTKIYGREDLITAVDLIYHSALQFNFQDNLIQKGWVEGLIIGDTRCGKTESLIRLIQHYKLGELCTGENISYAGLVGGMSQTQQRWSINWGKIPLNDRRLIVLDEVSSLDVDTISNLSALRSSGIAEIIKIQTERTNARTRLIWAANPRSGRNLDTYNYGVLAIKELIGKVEDIARFDFALSVSANEVPIEQINKRHESTIKQKFTSELCNKLILWAWSRKPEQIHITTEAEETILFYAMKLGNKYSSSIPLIEGAEQRIKLARMSVAIAARTFSTDDGENLIVKKEHVEFIYNYLEKIYSKPSMGYDLFSLSHRQATYLDDALRKSMEIEFKQFSSWKLLRDLLLEYHMFRKSEIIDQTGYEVEESRKLFRWMTANKLIKSTSIGYIKQPIFTAFLKDIDLEGEEPEDHKFNI